MKTVILAGGLGTRLSEETIVKPKPMVEVGGKPILWHILKHYAHFGFNEFILALGYKGEVIKEYFLNYRQLLGDVSIDLGRGSIALRGAPCEDWLVHMVGTGQNTSTGGRIKRLAAWLRDETFLLTYGDGVANVDLRALIAFHRGQRRLVTLTAVRPPARFGGIIFDGQLVKEFVEKPQIGEGWINGGYMVCEPGVLDYIAGDAVSLEADTLERLAADGQLAAFRHEGFWQCMDTLRDKRLLESCWEEGHAPWKVWEESDASSDHRP